LADPVTVVARLNFADYDLYSLNLQKRGDDLVVDLPDTTFQLWYQCFAESRPYNVSVIIKPDGLHLDTAGLKKHQTDIQSLAKDVRNAWEENTAAQDTNAPIPPYELFETLQDMCYNGTGNDGPKLIDQVWPKHFLGKETYWNKFLRELRRSPYWEDIRALNGWK